MRLDHALGLREDPARVDRPIGGRFPRGDLARVLAALGRFDEAAAQCDVAEPMLDSPAVSELCGRVRDALSP